MSTAAAKEQFTFQAEIKQLLHLLSHSLYQSREIAIRELISNASDALDKIRFLALKDSALGSAENLAITLEPDETAVTLTIADNGIGMTHDELVANLGTIAHSGSLSFLNKLTGDARKDLSLIGQFGVGFYSAFMLADSVRVLTRSYQEETGWEWESDGTGAFTITPAEGLSRGSRIVLHLKEEAKDFLKEWKLQEVVRKYSSFVPHPVKLGEKILNDAKPIWVEPKSKLTEEQYDGFYSHLTHRTDEKPLWHLHISVDSPIQFHSILYCPPSNVELLGFSRLEHGLYLCAKRILVQNDCRDLLPEYLRFLYGIVDSEDLPLNVSRETLQDNTVFRKIRSLLVKRTLERLQDLANDKPEEYAKFYKQFGPILREGIHVDYEHRQKIAKLLRFRSSAASDAETLTSLDDYIARSHAKQKQIFFASGPTIEAVRRSPNVEIFAKRKLEVLHLTDPIDEYLLTSLDEYEGRPIKSVDAADADIPETEESEAEKERPETPAGGFGKVLELFRSALTGKVEDVRESHRLTDSPCCLVNAEGGMSSQMQKLLKMAGDRAPDFKRTLEINPKASLIQRLCQLSANPDHDEFIRECGRQLFDNALLLEGQAPEPRDTVGRVQQFMQELAEKRSPLVL